MHHNKGIRSPYGIREPAVKPPVLPGKPNWVQSLLHRGAIMVLNRTQLQAEMYRKTRTTAQIQPSASTYETKFRAGWSGGTRSDDILPIIRPSTDIKMPWPVGTNVGRPRSVTGRDYSRRLPESARPIYFPTPAQYQALKSSSPGYTWDPSASKGANPREDLIPIGGRQQFFKIRGRDVVETVPTNNTLGYGLDYGPAPWRVPYIRKSGLQLMAGISQHSTQQQYAGVAGTGGYHSGALLAAPPVWRDITRGTRGVSGILQRVQGPGRSNMPSTFVPRSAQ
jgi:hypothetical protein